MALTCELYFLTAWSANQPKPVFAKTDVEEEEGEEER